MQPSISFVAIAIILVHHAGFVAEAKTPIVRECGTKSAAIIIDNASACIKSLKTSKSCSKKCNRIKDAILKGDNPTKCHKATVFSQSLQPTLQRRKNTSRYKDYILTYAFLIRVPGVFLYSLYIFIFYCCRPLSLSTTTSLYSLTFSH